MSRTATAGQRIRTTKVLDAVSGRIERFAEGRVRYATENLGRKLLMVEWDRGGSSVVFPEEVEIVEPQVETGFAFRHCPI